MFKRFGVGVVVVVLMLVVGLLALGYHFMRSSVPTLSGTATVIGLRDRVQIERDTFGVPSIYASTDRDAYFGLGYAEAEDRLFQMEMERRVGDGRLSEIIGRQGMTLDVWSRTIGFTRIAHQLWLHASKQTQEFLSAYVSGINAYIAEHRTKPGYEFDALHFTPEPWTPEQCLAIGRLMSWEMNFGYWTDGAFGDIALAVDSTHLAALLPASSLDEPTAVEGSRPDALETNWNGVGSRPPMRDLEDVTRRAPAMGDSTHAKPVGNANNTTLKATPSSKRPGKQPAVRPQTHKNPKPPAQKPSNRRINAPHVRIPIGAQLQPAEPNEITSTQLFSELAMVNRGLRLALGSLMSGGGSNSFVLSKSRTTTGSTLLENDTHLRLSTPARWYLAHLHSSEGLNVAGFGVPGLPLIIAGRNEYLSWGITSGMADESDFFVESTDSSGRYSLTPNGYKPITEFVDTIRMRDPVASNPLHAIPIFIRQTIHGPLILDHPFGLAHSYAHDERAGAIPRDTSFFKTSKPVSLQWNGEYALGDELGAFFALNRAHSVAQARLNLHLFATPILNLCLADRAGTISYELIGRMPRRNGSEARTLLPRSGSAPWDQWLGFISAGELATITNPARGYIVSANNPPARNRPIPISAAWEPGARADRIAALIESDKRLNVEAASAITGDITSPFDRDLVLPYLLALYPDPTPFSLSPDSSWYYRLDSLHHVWRWDSMLHHTSLPDTTARRMIHADSLAMKTYTPPRTNASSVQTPITLALEYLRNWDGAMRENETAPAIYAVFLNTLFKKLYADELGPDRFAEFCYDGDLPMNSLSKLLREPHNVWWDDVNTHGAVPETRDSIIKLSLNEALRVLTDSFGTDMSRWQWGRLHSLTYRHQFESAGAAIAKLVNIEVGPVSGGLTTVSQATYDIWNPFAMRVGPSMRMIAEMRSNLLLAALPTGNSESVFGPHYRDMLELFKRGDYDAIDLGVRSEPVTRFELLPAN